MLFSGDSRKEPGTVHSRSAGLGTLLYSSILILRL
uniref:Uncharacterized protein n=1 Tax=Anguilla anguilla TaxID=7936 RepID=A0A0E9W7N0_ANGAN